MGARAGFLFLVTQAKPFAVCVPAVFVVWFYIFRQIQCIPGGGGGPLEVLALLGLDDSFLPSVATAFSFFRGSPSPKRSKSLIPSVPLRYCSGYFFCVFLRFLNHLKFLNNRAFIHYPSPWTR